MGRASREKHRRIARKRASRTRDSLRRRSRVQQRDQQASARANRRLADLEAHKRARQSDTTPPATSEDRGKYRVAGSVALAMLSGGILAAVPLAGGRHDPHVPDSVGDGANGSGSRIDT